MNTTDFLPETYQNSPVLAELPGLPGYLIVAPDGEEVLIQTDWSYPGVASRLGWGHEHGETDGTIDCPVCGQTAWDMIQEAREVLDENVGEPNAELWDYF